MGIVVEVVVEVVVIGVWTIYKFIYIVDIHIYRRRCTFIVLGVVVVRVRVVVGVGVRFWKLRLGLFQFHRLRCGRLNCDSNI